ncbi:MAG: c-type cytochrome, partial [Vicinamibacteria bacterium]
MRDVELSAGCGGRCLRRQSPGQRNGREHENGSHPQRRLHDDLQCPCSRSSKNAAVRLASQAPAAAPGRQLYVTHCATCHGTSGRGDGPMA